MTKIKSAKKTAKIAWNASPSGDPYLLAAATLEGTITGDFESVADLELLSANPSHEGHSMRSIKRVPIAEGVTSLAWGALGSSLNGGRKHGILASGSSSGSVTLYNPDAILNE